MDNTRTNNKREAEITRALIAGTLMFAVLLVARLSQQGLEAYVRGDVPAIAEVLAFAVSVLFLIYGNLVYQWCRLAHCRRTLAHRPAPQHDIEQLFEQEAPSLAILIPSYKEETRVVLLTLLSAAFTHYPRKRVILLVDDPANFETIEDEARLRDTRQVVGMLQTEFNAAADLCRSELAAFAQRAIEPADELLRLAHVYRRAGRWFEALAQDALSEWQVGDPSHVDTFFTTHIVEAAARRHVALAETLREQVRLDQLPDRSFLHQHYHRLADLFDVSFSVFERKQYVNLSHEPNKAMNLNTYIGLMGRSWQQAERPDGHFLREVTRREADFTIPGADYLITLDADSLLLPEYALRLVHLMEQPEHARVAIAQTPYSAFPDAPSALERIAGATTDLQYIVHQGFTGGGATFWVGANALIRHRALEDIKRSRVERGHSVSVYIQDRTLIEDTESSIDLIQAGWSLHNYPERLAYSATPSDFGALLIQRRRWANGGLLILGNLIRYAWSAPKNLSLLREMVLRFHYLVSLAAGSVATLLLFFYPFDDAFAIAWLPLSAVPYFVLYARDLRLRGYRSADVLRVYALNLVLLPVVMGGVLKSVQQGITGVKTPFGRTPKVTTRSASPAVYCAIQLALPAAFFFGFIWDALAGRWAHATCALLNGMSFGYAVITYLGVQNTIADLTAWKSSAGAAQIPARARPVGSLACLSVTRASVGPGVQTSAKCLAAINGD